MSPAPPESAWRSARRLAIYKITLAALSSDVVDSSYFYALKHGFLPLYYLALFEVLVIIVSPASAIMMNADANITGFRLYTQPSSSSTMRTPRAASSVTQTPRKTPFQKVPLWLAHQDEPLQISARTLSSEGSGRSAADTGPEFHSHGGMGKAMKQHPTLLLDDGGQADGVICGAPPSASNTRTGDSTTGRPPYDTASQSSMETADSFEIPEMPSASEEVRCPRSFSLVRAMGKRLDSERPQHLLLGCMYPQEG